MYLEAGIIHFSCKLNTGIDPTINFELVKCLLKKYIQLKHSRKIEGSLTSKRNSISARCVCMVFSKWKLKFLDVFNHCHKATQHIHHTASQLTNI